MLIINKMFLVLVRLTSVVSIVNFSMIIMEYNNTIQFQDLQRLRQNIKEYPDITMANNFRMTSKLNNRPIRTNVDHHKVRFLITIYNIIFIQYKCIRFKNYDISIIIITFKLIHMCFV